MPTDSGNTTTDTSATSDAGEADPGAVVAALARDLLDNHLEDMVAELVEVVVTAETVYRDQDVVDQLEESVRGNMRSVLANLARRQAADLTHPQRTARARADQGVPLESVLHAYGLAFRLIWSHMVELAMAQGEAKLHLLLRLISFILTY